MTGDASGSGNGYRGIRGLKHDGALRNGLQTVFVRHAARIRVAQCRSGLARQLFDQRRAESYPFNFEGLGRRVHILQANRHQNRTGRILAPVRATITRFKS